VQHEPRLPYGTIEFDDIQLRSSFRQEQNKTRSHIPTWDSFWRLTNYDCSSESDVISRFLQHAAGDWEQKQQNLAKLYSYNKTK